MRVSSLSDERVISLISRYFVPAWASRDNYQLDPSDTATHAEMLRLDRERGKRGLEGGTVCVFIVDPDGSVVATQRVQTASNPENLAPFLARIIAEKQLTPRRPAAVRATTAQPEGPKPATEGGVLVHVWTRCDLPGPNRGVGQDRVELTRAEWQTFVPPTDARPGTAWPISSIVAHKLFRYCYPPRPHWNVKESRVLGGKLTATLLTRSSDETRLQLEGELSVRYPNEGKPTDGIVTAHLIGVAHYHPGRQALTALALVSDRADYVWHWEGKPQQIPMRLALDLER
jgi:hypothetical protein